jgi:hypothetical protein
MAYRMLKRRQLGATFDELMTVMHEVPRREAKRLARLHGHPWDKIRRELQRRGQAFQGESVSGP